MRVVGRYFAVGASLGSVSGLVALVLIWSWMTIHLGLLGFLVGWIPAGLAAGAIWLTMVVFWGPVVVVAAMIAAALLVFGAHGHRGRDWDTRSPDSEPEVAPSPPETEAPRDAAPPRTDPEPEPAPLASPPAPAETPSVPPFESAPLPETPSPPATPVTKPAPPPRSRPPTDELGGDAAAAGDTSRRHPR
jgi:hypothetical protein